MPPVPGHRNRTWLRPFRLAPTVPGATPAEIDRSKVQDSLDLEHQSRWYVISGVPAGADVTVTLENGCGIDLTLLGFTDVKAKADQLLQQLGRGALDADDMDSDDMDSDDMDSDDMDSDDMDSDDMDSDDMDSDDMDSDDMDSDDIMVDQLAAEKAQYANVYNSAQRHALRSASVTAGPADEQIHMVARAGGGDLYFRVRGHHGAFEPNKTFTISAQVEPSHACPDEIPVPAWRLPRLDAEKDLTTLILTHTGRRESLDLQENGPRGLLDDLWQLARSPKVKGTVYDLAEDTDRLGPLYAAWKAAPACVPIANAIAESVRGLIAEVRVAFPNLKYVVFAGGDDVIPFARIEDRARISREWQWLGPYDAATPLGAALTYGYYLSDDPYGRTSQFDPDRRTAGPGPLDQRGKSVRTPDLATGRLVEKAADIKKYLDWYQTDGQKDVRIQDALPAGYTFVEDLANEIADTLAGAGVRVDRALITDSTANPPKPDWTAGDLRAKLGSQSYQLIAPQGHYSPSTLRPADPSDRVRPTDLTAGQPRGAIWMTIGCHSGHDVIDSEVRSLSATGAPGSGAPAAGAPNPAESWAEALLRRGNTLVGGTGYQYAESELLENSERLYTFLTQEIASAPSAPLGDALLHAKARYLEGKPELSGMDEKLLEIPTIYGLPMLRVGVPKPIPPTPIPQDASKPADRADGTFTRVITFDHIVHTPQQTRDGDNFFTVGGDEIVARPLRPVLPGILRDISLQGDAVAQGIVWMDGQYAEVAYPKPFIALPFTEEDRKKPKYRNRTFLPNRPFSITRNRGRQKLVFTPLQVRLDENTERARKWSSAKFTVYYSSRTDATTVHDAPGLELPRVTRDPAGGLAISINVRHYGAPAENIAVWAGYLDGGQLRTVPLSAPAFQTDGVTPTSTEDGVGWVRTCTGSLRNAPQDAGVFFQAVGGNGRVAALSNSGDGLAVAPASAPPESDLVLKMNGKPAYRERIGVTATLVRHGTTTPIAGEMVQLRLGGSRVWAKTDASGVASGTLTLAVPPRPTDYLLVASFAGSAHAGPAAAAQALRVGKQATSIKVLQDLDVSTTPQPIRVAQLYATPGSTQPRPLGERRMILAVDGHAFVGWTDAEGAIWFDRKDLHGVPHGTYQGKLQFEGDARYAASEEPLKVNV